MEDRTVIEKYEALMMNPDYHFYLSGTPKEKENGALAIVRYIVSDLLGWTPQEALACMNRHVAEEMHVDKLLVYVDFSKDVAKEDDYDYVIYRAFPNEVDYNPYKKIIKLYRKILSGDKVKFPKRYFNKTPDGYMRANCILLYAIQTNLVFQESDMLGLFKYFSNAPAINKKLKEWKILAACKMLYDGDALAFLHNTVDGGEETDFLYNNFKFNKILDAQAAMGANRSSRA